MVFQHLSSDARRRLRREALAAARARPAVLTEMPRETWPPDGVARLRAWHSQRFLAQLFAESPVLDIQVLRLSVCRVTLKHDGHWEEGISWAELMQVKRECGFADQYAVEVYPRDRDVIDDANLRHLWLLSRPLPIGWTR